MPAHGTQEVSIDMTIGRIVSVTGAKAIVLLDGKIDPSGRKTMLRPEMGTLLAIDTTSSVVLAIVSALSVPVPAQREGDSEIWIAELGLVGELWFTSDRAFRSFNRGVTIYPALGDRVRIASKPELEFAFCGDTTKSVRVGCIRQDSTIPAMVRVDDLLGKHFAILGTTGTGKSCTTALILRSILNENPAAHIVLLDPHNEYATAFTEWAEVISPRNMQLPFWLLTFDEIVEVLVGDLRKKPEIEILQELIPIAKSRYSSGRNKDNNLRRGLVDHGRYTVDTPVPYRISDLMAMIDERMGKLENKKDLAPYRNLKQHIEMITQDGRYSFMFGSLTVYDGMTQVLSRIFRVPVNGKPITILELTGIPAEIVNVVVAVLCRMTFDFALWGEGKVPVTIVCEEAHRYVPANPSAGFEPCKRAIAKIAKEGRKYGASLCIVTQRPAEIDPTILSQCNTVFALRMSNDRDQEIVTSAISDTGSGLLEFLSALGQREAIAFGDGVSLPVRIKFDELPKSAMPRSSTARFSERWQKSVGDEGYLEQIVERWRNSGLSQDDQHSGQMMADALLGHTYFDQNADPQQAQNNQPRYDEPAGGRYAGQQSFGAQGRGDANSGRGPYADSAAARGSVRRDSQHVDSRRDSVGFGAGNQRSATSSLRRTEAAAMTADAEPQGQALRTLRDRLMQRPR
ncbi:MAG: ATP-binding protein [Hyphomicrobiaceae bacterium]|nr:ATP-binding protein [Hyphomicrobiaceae bacterium]MCC0008275.1 ATP-binding protein [Hyphomicrobiaceae bacterium]